MRDIIAGVLLLSGSLLAVIAGIGLHRFPDVFARMHAATKPATFGLALVVVGAALRVDHADAAAKLLLVAVLQFVTAPTAAHLIGRAAHRAGTELSDQTVMDDLAAAQSRPPRVTGRGGTAGSGR